MQKFYLFLLIFLVITSNSFGQNALIEPSALGYFNDALRFSQTTISGTARFQALAGAQTALGADMGCFTGNPAGLGMFQKFTIDFSLGTGLGITNTDFQGEETWDAKPNMHVSNFGFVFPISQASSYTGAWRGGLVGIGYTRLADYHSNISYSGTNTQNSLTDAYAERANGIPSTELDAQQGAIVSTPALAYFTYLINPFVNDPQNRYFSVVNGAAVQQSETLKTKGSLGQWSFSFAGNVADRFYFGFTLGVMTLKYEIEKKYKESIVSQGADSVLNSFQVEDKITTNGSGVRASVGFLWRITSFWRIGATFTTPTYIEQQETFNTNIKASFNNYTLSNGYVLRQESQEMLPGDYNYNLLTPFRASFGTAFFFDKWGFISVDGEYVDYSMMRLGAEDSFVFNADNRTIQQVYQPVWNLKAGVEVRLAPWYFRGGYAIFPDAFRTEVDALDRTVRHITVGFGKRSANNYFDFTVRNSSFRSVYTPYTLQNNAQPVARTFTNFWQIVISSGFFF